MKKKNILYFVTIFVLLTLVKLPVFMSAQFGELGVDQILFVILGDNTGANFEIVFTFIKESISTLIFTIIICYILYLVEMLINRFNIEVFVSFFNLRSHVLFNHKTVINLFWIVVCVSLFNIALYYNSNFQIYTYIKSRMNVSNLYEEYYINPLDVDIDFPSKKKNLIYIITESMNTNFSSMDLDDSDHNLIENLEVIAKNNITFSHNNELGGPFQVGGLGWTMGSLVGQTSGVPLAGPLEGNSYGNNGDFLPGLTSIGEVLEKNDYKNYFAIGSEAPFGGRDITLVHMEIMKYTI